MPFLLILFIIFIVLPVCWLVYKYFVWRRRAREFMNDPLGFFMRQQQAAAERAAGDAPRRQKPRRRKKKKIDPDVGEYVAFKEVSTETRTSDGTHTSTTYIKEEQVSDAQWEDIR